MSDKKISQLTALDAATRAATDVLPIVDVSAGETKKITVGQLFTDPVVDGGTANGVAYLNGSKVLTSGSALTFDGTEFKVNAASGNVLVQPSNVANAKLYLRHGSIGNNNGFEVDVSSNTIFLQAGSEAMRLTSTGLGIGTSSPGYKLHVSATASTAGYFTSSGAVTTVDLDNTNANGWGGNIAIKTGGTAAGYFGTIGSLLGNTTQDLAVYATDGNGFRVYTNGNNERLRLSTTEAVFNNPGNDYDFRVESDTNTHALFVEGSSGNVGIGTSSPGSLLDVAGGVQATGAVMRLTNSASSSSWVAGDVVGAVDFYSTDASFPGTKAQIKAFADTGNGTIAINYSALSFSTMSNSSFAERMRLDSSGNLGLGVTPSAWFTGGVLQGSSYSVSSIAGADQTAWTTGAYQATYVGSWLSRGAYRAAMYQQLTGSHAWFTNSVAPTAAGQVVSFTQAMTLDASGNLGVGTTSPNAGGWGKAITLQGASNAAFEVTDGTVRTSLIAAAGAAGYVSTDTNHPLIFRTNNTERARIDSSGNLLVGKTSGGSTSTAGCEFGTYGAILTRSSGDALLVNREASDGPAVTLRRSNVTVGSISVTTSATAYNTSSDYRLKENIQDITGSGAFIDALQPRSWNWKVDGSAGAGFIAHELQAVSPSSVVGEKDAVDADGNPEYQAVEYGSAEVIAMLVAEVKSLRARLNAAGL